MKKVVAGLLIVSLLLCASCSSADKKKHDRKDRDETRRTTASRETSEETTEEATEETYEVETQYEEIPTPTPVSRPEPAPDAFRGHELPLSEAGMPDVDVVYEEGIYILDDNHPELKAAVENVTALFSDIDATYIMYRVDNKVLSFRVTESETKAIHCFNFNMLGEELALRDVVIDPIVNCEYDLTSEIERYEYLYAPFDGYEVASLEDLSICKQFLLDANSIIINFNQDYYRINIYDNSLFINPDLIPDGSEMYGIYMQGYLPLETEAVTMYPGWSYGPAFDLASLSFVGHEDVNVLAILLGFDVIFGYLHGQIYVDGTDIYLFVYCFGNEDEYTFHGVFRLEDRGLFYIYSDVNNCVDEMDGFEDVAACRNYL